MMPPLEKNADEPRTEMSEEQKPAGDEPKQEKKRKRGKKAVDPKQVSVAMGRARGMTLQEAGETAGYTPERAGPLDSLAEDVNRLRRAKRMQFFHKRALCLIIESMRYWKFRSKRLTWVYKYRAPTRSKAH
jgi:hypothetical protein